MTDLILRTDTASDTAIINSIDGDNYKYHVRDFTSWLNRNTLPLTEQSVIEYFKYLNTSDYANSTKRIKRQAVKKRLLQLAHVKGYTREQRESLRLFLADLDNEGATKAPKIQAHAVGKEKYLTAYQVQRLLEYSTGAKQNMLIRFLWATGARVSELTGAKYQNCKQIGDTVHIRIIGKGNKERVLKIPYAMLEEIQATFKGSIYLFETRNGKPYARQQVSDQIGKVTKRLFGHAYRAHTLRHSFATRKIKQGKQLSYISKYLGHSNVNITATMYDHGEISEQDLFDDLV